MPFQSFYILFAPMRLLKIPTIACFWRFGEVGYFDSVLFGIHRCYVHILSTIKHTFLVEKARYPVYSFCQNDHEMMIKPESSFHIVLNVF